MPVKHSHKGVIIPAVTPLTGDYELDEGAVARIFSRFYACNCSPFILGTTGESASLPLNLKEHYVLTAERLKRPGTLLYAGISSNIIAESTELARFCADHAVDAVACTVPSYYALTEYQMRMYFEKLADSIPLPLIIYNIPATTHMSIPLGLIDELSHHPNIVGTKDSERSEERLVESLKRWKHRDDFSHFLGWATKSAEALFDGSDGLIPSTGNLFPEIYSEMVKAVANNDPRRAGEMQGLSDLYGNLYQGGRTLGGSLWALKVLMKEEGSCQSFVMPPLQPGTKEEESLLIKSLKEIKEKQV